MTSGDSSVFDDCAKIEAEINMEIDMKRLGFFPIGWINEFHMESGVRVIDDFTLIGVSIGPRGGYGGEGHS